MKKGQRQGFAPSSVVQLIERLRRQFANEFIMEITLLVDSLARPFAAIGLLRLSTTLRCCLLTPQVMLIGL